jgi:hypothetical protein
MRWNCTVLVFCVFTATVVGAATLHVPLEYLTIQAGVDSASVGDTVLVAPGTYAGTGNTNIRFWGADIALVSSSGAASTIIDCEGQSRAFKLLDGESRSAVIEGFSVLDGFAKYGGGGGYFDGSSPTVSSCVFSGCFVEGEFDGQYWPAFGGAVYIVFGGDPLFANCSFVGNEILGEPSYGTDVTIYNSAVTFQECLFAYGTDNGELYGDALGVDAGGANFTIERCLFTDSAGYPGYVHVADPGLCDWYPGSQIGFELCSDSPALPENNDWDVLVGAFGAGCGPCVTAVEHTSWGMIKATFR